MFALLSSPCYPFKKQAKVITLHSITITVTLTERKGKVTTWGTKDSRLGGFSVRSTGRWPGAGAVCSPSLWD